MGKSRNSCMISMMEEILFYSFTKSHEICFMDFTSRMGKPLYPILANSDKPLKFWELLNCQQQFPVDSIWINFRSSVKILLPKSGYFWLESRTVFIDLNSSIGSFSVPDSVLPLKTVVWTKVRDPSQESSLDLKSAMPPPNLWPISSSSITSFSSSEKVV